MARLVRSHDWAATPLGPSASWPQPLRTMVEVMLASPMLASLAVGPERVFLYNDEAARHYGHRHPAVLGMSLPRAFQEFPQVAPFYDRVFAGESLHVPAQPLDPAERGTAEVFDAYLMPVRDEAGAVIAAAMTGFAIGERLRADAALRDSEERQVFLLTLSDALRSNASAEEVIAVATRLLGERLGASRIVFGEIDEAAGIVQLRRGWAADGATPLPATVRLADFGGPLLDDLRRDRTVRFDEAGVLPHARPDLAALAAIGIHAGLSVPLLVNGALTANLNVHQDRPRRWTVAEIGLVEEVAERLWAAVGRARAEKELRDNEERHAFLLALADRLRPLIDPDDVLCVATRALGEHLGADRVGYAEDQAEDGEIAVLFDYVRDVPSLIGPYHYDDYGPELLRAFREGRCVVRPDIAGDPSLTAAEKEAHARLQLGATVNVPLLAAGVLKAVLFLHFRAAHAFDERELSLLYGVAERTWTALQRTRAETALRASEQRSRTVLEGISEAFYALDSGSRFLFASRSALTWWGRRAEEVVGRTMLDCFPSAGGSEVWEAHRRVMRTGVAEHLEIVSPVLHRWIAVDLAATREGGLSVGFRDIEERKRAEAALRESEERLRQFGEASQDVLWIRDAEMFQWIYLTPAFEAIYGMDRQAALSGDTMANWIDLILPEDRARAVASLERVRAGERVTFEYRVRRPSDGQVRWLRNTDFPIRDDADRVVRIGGVGHDATLAKEAEEALAAAEQRQRLLLEGIPQLVWRSGGDGLWTWSSPQWQGYTGQTQPESDGWGWLEAIHPDDREATYRAWLAAPSHGRLDVEQRVRRAADDTWRWHATRAVPVRAVPRPGEAEGRITEWLGTTTDIEHLKRLQGQQQVLVAELQHRTRNLLAVVRNVARRSIGPSPGRDEYDARLAALSRVQSFLSRSTFYTVPLADLVEAELKATGDGASAKVVIRGPPVTLPGEGVQAVALALHELATNAVKYGALAQAAGRLVVAWQVEPGEPGEGAGGRRLVIDWRESGVAMPPGPPARRGYGSELITRALPYQLHAETLLEFKDDGVHCRIALPATAFSVAVAEGEG